MFRLTRWPNPAIGALGEKGKPTKFGFNGISGVKNIASLWQIWKMWSILFDFIVLSQNISLFGKSLHFWVHDFHFYDWTDVPKLFWICWGSSQNNGLTTYLCSSLSNLQEELNISIALFSFAVKPPLLISMETNKVGMTKFKDWGQFLFNIMIILPNFAFWHFFYLSNYFCASK